MMCPTVICSIFSNGLVYEVLKNRINPYLLSASLTATAQATVIPTMGLLPAPIRQKQTKLLIFICGGGII